MLIPDQVPPQIEQVLDCSMGSHKPLSLDCQLLAIAGIKQRNDIVEAGINRQAATVPGQNQPGLADVD